MKSAILLSAALLVFMTMFTTGCGEQEPPSLTLAGLKNATYTGIEEQDPVTLKDGFWQGEPFVEGGASRPRVGMVRDFHLLGDLDGDGVDEAAVLLSASSAGTGENIYLAVVGLKEGQLQNLGTTLVGDRVQIRKAGILEGRVFLDLLRAGPEDAMCCPGELAMVAWELNDGGLIPLAATGETGRLSVETIAETKWVLRWWDLEEEAPIEPEVTLFFKDGRLGGTSGCNTYFAAANIGDQPGEVSMGPAGGTMMMCSEEDMAVEQRFLVQMGGVTRFGFLTGMLALSFEFDGEHGVMLFEEREGE
jgi:heat shock protein HslJ